MIGSGRRFYCSVALVFSILLLMNTFVIGNGGNTQPKENFSCEDRSMETRGFDPYMTSFEISPDKENSIEESMNLVNENGEFFSINDDKLNLKKALSADADDNLRGQLSPSMVEYGGYHFLGYYSRTWTSYRLIFSTDQGNTWSDPIDVLNCSYTSSRSTIAIEVHRDRLFYILSNNGEDGTIMKSCHYRDSYKLEENKPVTLKINFHEFISTLSLDKRVYIFLKSGSMDRPVYYYWEEGSLSEEYHFPRTCLWFIPSVSSVGNTRIIQGLYQRDAKSVWIADLSIVSGIWENDREITSISGSFFNIASISLEGGIHICYSDHQTDRIHYLIYDQEDVVLSRDLMTVGENGADPVEKEIAITTDGDHIRIAVEGESGTVRIISSYDGGESYNMVITLGAGSVHSPVMDRNGLMMTVMNGSNLELFEFEPIPSARILSVPLSPVGLVSWDDIGFSFMGLSKGGRFDFRILSAEDNNQIYPDRGFVNALELDEGFINSRFHDHVVALNGSWTIGDGIEDRIRIEIEISRDPSERFELYSVVMNYSVDYPYVDQFRIPEHLLSMNGCQISEGGLVINDEILHGEFIYGPIEGDPDLPDHVYLTCTALTDRGEIRAEVLSRDLTPVEGYGLNMSKGIKEKGISYLIWEDKCIADLPPDSVFFIRFDISNLNGSNIIVKNIGIEYSSPPNLISISSPSREVNRGEDLVISLTVEDREDPVDFIDVDLEYKGPQSDVWTDEMLSEQIYRDGCIEFTFMTDITSGKGEYDFRGKLTDSAGMSTTFEEVGYTVNIRNNLPLPPEIRIFPAYPRVTDDIQVGMLFPGSDVETERDNLSYEMIVRKNGAEVMAKSDLGTPSYTIEKGIGSKNEMITIEMYTWDGENRSEPDVVDFRIENSLPLTHTKEGYVIHEDGNLSIPFSEIFTDHDKDIITINANGPDWIRTKILTDELLINPDPDSFGTGTIELKITDGSDNVSTSFEIEVVPVNDMPTLNEAPPIRMKQGEIKIIPLEIRDDRDGERVHITSDIEEVIPGARIGKELVILPNGSIILEATNSMVGEHIFHLIITDHTHNLTEDITLMIENTNDPPSRPTYSVEPDQKLFTEGEHITFKAHSDDPDLIWGDHLSYYWSSDIQGPLGNGTNVTSILEEGVHTIDLKVEDEEGAVNRTSFRLNVLPKMPDVDPTIKTGSLLLIIGFLSLGLSLFISFIIVMVSRRKSGPSEEEEAPEETLRSAPNISTLGGGEGMGALGPMDEDVQELPTLP
mgnify:CR=1 FL=1